MKSKFSITNFLPIILFSFIVIISGLVLYKLRSSSSPPPNITSQLIGKKIPEVPVKLANLNLNINNEELLNFKNYQNQLFAVNFFASWCAPCRVEAPLIEDLSKIIPVIGIAYKDKDIDTKKFLEEFGNPYKKIGADSSGKIAIEWGVYGVPETFLINEKGDIIYRHAGPLLYNVFKSEILPLVKNKNQ